MSNQSSMMPGQRPNEFGAPYSQEAEEAVLGAVMVNPDAFLGVASFLKTEDFYILRHGYIWDALMHISERNDQIDFVTVVDELRAMNHLNDIGGPGYLLHLVNSTPTSVHAEVYGRLVERAGVRRRLLTAADEIKALAMDEQLSIEKVTSDSESKLFRVTERNLRRELIPMRDAINTYFERMEHLIQHPDEPLGLPTGFRDLDELLGGLQRSDLLIFAGRPGMGKCVAEGTLIHTDSGLIPIESLKPAGVVGIPDDEGGTFYPLEIGVQSPDGLKRTSHFYDSGVKPTLRIQTRAGYSLTGTHVHPLLVLDRCGAKVWKSLSELQCGDYVAVQRHAPAWGNVTALPEFNFKFNDNLRSTKVPTLPTEITPDLAYILGVLAGDGNLTRTNYVSFTSADPEIVETLYRWVDQLGLHVRHRENYDHQIGSIVLNAWLKDIGLSGYAYEKEIPYTILQSPQECVAGFLQGLFDTDGHAEVQRGYIQYASSSEKLARQVHTLLLQFGIVSKLTYKANDYRGAWYIRITGNAARVFYNSVGFRLERKQNRSELLPLNANSNLDVVPYLPPRVSMISGTQVNYYRYFKGNRSPSYAVLEKMAEFAPEVQGLLEPEFYWDEIIQIDDAGMKHCYDLCVPDGHAFVSNGIVSHNTSFLLSVALNAAKLGAHILIFTMEMGHEQLVQRFVSMETGINTQKLRTGQLLQQEWERFVAASGRLGNLNIFIDDTPAMTPIQMRTKCRRIAHEYGLDLVIVDYMQLMSAGSGYENNRVQEISYISRSLKELARELNVPLFSAAQLSRAVEQRQDKRPQLSDLRESGCIAGDTLIYLPDSGSYVPIRDLMDRSGFNVLALNPATWKLESAEVSRAFCTGTKPVYKLTTCLGRTIQATANHKFMTVGGWKRLDELMPDDCIALPRTLTSPIKQTMSNSELALLGHLIGDGCTLPKHAIQYTTKEVEIGEIVSNLAKEVFGDRVKPRIQQEKGHNWYQVFLAPTKHLTHGVHNPVRVWLESLGVFGLRSYEKYVPKNVFEQPNEAIAVFLRHLWTTDGCIGVKPAGNQSHYPAIYYASSSKRLASDVQSLLLRFEINARIMCIPQKGKGRDQYHVTVTGKPDFERFIQFIGAVGSLRQERLSVVARYTESREGNTNRDIIPRPMWRMHAVPAMQQAEITTRQMQAQLGNNYCGTGLYKQNVSRERAARLAQVVQSSEIAALATSDVYWDGIMSIEPDGETEVYDLTVPSLSNFVAGNIIVHNSIEQDADIVIFLYRDVVYNEATEFPARADLLISKHRNGPTGTISLHFEKSLTKFTDARTQTIDLSAL